MSPTPRPPAARRLVCPLLAALLVAAAAGAQPQPLPPVAQAQPDVGPPVPDHRKEPRKFVVLMATNPQFFVQQNSKGVTTWEQLTCVGFNPDTNELKATIQVKRPSGYGGDLCDVGSREYVRFYVNYGAAWEDVGVAAAAAHDIPNSLDCEKKPTKPLSYVAGLRFHPKTDKCGNPVLPLVRAILSWNTVPPSGMPNWLPPYGNRLDTHIQIKPSNPIVFKPIKLADAAKLYAAQAEKPAVEPHRFGLPDVAPVLTSPEKLAVKAAEWKDLGLDLAAALDALKQFGNTSYEQLNCVGLDNNSFPERLVATFRIKKPVGYSGNLCQPGSKEYVAFWVDWDNTCKWSYVGTAAVAVHDIPTIPSGGLSYSAVLPVDLSKHRRDCHRPKVLRVRAVLSWGTPPSTTNPEAVPHWGNRRDVHVQLNPGTPSPGGAPTPIIGILGGIPVSKIKADPALPIDPATTGMTLPGAAFVLNGLPADAHDRPCPFGARVVIQGPQYPGFKYRVQVRHVGGAAWSTVTTPMKVWNLEGTIQSTVAPDAAGLFTFLTPTAANPHPNADGLIAWWDAGGDDLMEVKLELANSAGTILPGADVKRVRVSNQPADVSVSITSSANCHKYTVGQTLQGKFVARHPYFGSFGISVSPFDPPHGPPDHLTPRSGLTQTSLAGDNWTLNTAGMIPCGYVLTVAGSDRVIYNSVSTGRTVYAPQPIGFCLDGH
jgi:hypothetical protein